MEELGLGPNGALLYCMEFLLQNLDWLQDELEQFGDDDYLILDTPGRSATKCFATDVLVYLLAFRRPDRTIDTHSCAETDSGCHRWMGLCR